MAPKPIAFDLSDERPRGDTTSPPPVYLDIDRIESAEGLVTVFSQRRRDGVITFSVHRRFDVLNDGEVKSIITAFSPESMMAAYIAHVTLTAERLVELQEKRARGELKFPEGGEKRPSKRRP